MQRRATRARTCFCILALIAFSSGVHAQYWAKDFGGTGGDRIADVKVDAQDNVYVIGEFSASMTFDGQSLVSAGGTDAFVAKVDPDGNLLWMVRAGGSAIDRGLKIAVDANGTVAVTGQFMGTANLFGTTVTSGGGTMDVFTAKLDAATGDAAWVSTGGSSAFIDRPYGVSISPNGNLSVVGEFRGEALFGGQPLTSTLDPTTNQPSTDVFIASYSGTGTLLWVQQGAAKFADRAIDVVSDAANNLYVCGQFSDTVTFDAVHDNAMFNATFLIKLDAAGNESWFRRCGGAAFDHVRDMLLTSNNELLLCGDLQGSMVYLDAAPHVIDGGAPHAYYLMRVGLDGEFISSSVVPSDNPVSARSIDQRADTVAVFGEFDCQFTGLSAHYDGTGPFMALGAPDLFIARHAFTDLGLRDAQQFAGHQDKSAGAVVSLADGALVFGGMYEKLLFIPANTQQPYWTDWPWYRVDVDLGCEVYNGNGELGTYCGDPDYGVFGLNWSAGLRDGILARAYIQGRSPYDIWRRTPGDACDRSRWEPCIHRTYYGDYLGNCADTIRLCDESSGGNNDHISMIATHGIPFTWAPDGDGDGSDGCLDGSIGFEVDILWSTGETTPSIHITEGGWYWCRATTRNGCWSWTDSIYAVPYDFPCPLVNDQFGINVAACPAQYLECVDQTWLWCENTPSDATLHWYDTNNYAEADSFWVAQSGVVHAYFRTPDGCFAENELAITIDPGIVTPNVTAIELEFFYEGEVLDMDTITLCRNDWASGTIHTTWYIDGALAPNPTIGWFQGVSSCGNVQQPASAAIGWCIQAWEEGWQQVVLSAVYTDGECGEQNFPFSGTDSIYVEVLDPPSFEVDVPAVICPGDTLPIVLLCSACDSIAWSEESLVGLSADRDTAWINAPGNVGLIVSAIEGDLVCSTGITLTIDPPVGPHLFVEPAVVCPGGSALIHTNMQGTNLSWLGPDGPIASQNDSLWVDVTGEYFLTMTDQYGCEVGGGPITLNLVGTPYMDVTPSVILCPNETATLEVFTNDPEAIQWDAPFSGNSTTQVVTEAGSYSCSVTSCGTTTMLSVQILAGEPDATVEGGPYLICAGEQLVLEGPPGQLIYFWEPMDEYAESITVDQPGDYQLIVFEGFGCSDTSEVLHVEVWPVAEPLQAQDLTLCAGEDAWLVATGSGVLTWYANAEGTEVLAVNDSLHVSGATESTTFYVAQVVGDCTSNSQAVQLTLTDVPTTVALIGPDSVCVGDPLELGTSAPAGTTVVWNTPTGPFTGSPFTIAFVGMDDAGIYTIATRVGDCTGGGATHDLFVFEPALLDLGPDTLICAGTTIALHVPGWFSNPQWSDGSTSQGLLVSSTGTYTVHATDLHGCSVTDARVVTVEDCNTSLPNIISPNGDGNNDLFVIDSAGGHVRLTIFNRWGSIVTELNGSVVEWNGTNANSEAVPDGVYFYELDKVPVVGKAIRQTGYLHLMR